MYKKITVAAALALAACTHPADVTRPTTELADKNAKFAVQDTPRGFTVDVRYSRYQFVPEASALIEACRSLVVARAQDEAKSRGREIVPLDLEAIRVSTGRNILGGRTSCRAFAEATYRS